MPLFKKANSLIRLIRIFALNLIDEKREKLQNKNGNDLFRKPIYIEGKKNDVELECSIKWNAGYSEDIFPYTNNIKQTLLKYLKV